ncbi:MAG: exodeoxyribonuclease VII large subunit [Methanomicrobiales archaeon]|nr:exodeoxyribonuclease VII large subunit [Methanomicrobiales archaeon]
MDETHRGSSCNLVNRDILGVMELSCIIREVLGDRRLQDVWVKGEVTNHHNHRSGHRYFTLTEQRTGKTYAVDCVLWRSDAEHLDFPLDNGMGVIAFGSVDHFPPQGRTQFYVRELRKAGEGEKHLIVERWRRELAEEGLFSHERKRPLPEYPCIVGVVTSPTGAVVQDIRNVIGRRFPVELLISPTRVQGEGAHLEIARAIARIDGKVDVLIVARGGGSFEDLFPFNHPEVVRAIAGCGVPVVSAIGHEVDVTLSDLAADVRAPTPSAAAELVVKDRRVLKSGLLELRRQMATSLDHRLYRGREELEGLKVHLHPNRGRRRIGEKRQELDQLSERLERAIRNRVEQSRSLTRELHANLRSLDPHAPLARGYALIRKGGRTVRSINEIMESDIVELNLHDGEARAMIEEVKYEEKL